MWQRLPAPRCADYEEYTWLYAESWYEPAVRWLLSTVPTSMIFDDHDVRDDWNTSQSWRDEVEATPWWEERIVGALASYWVYQHLGNLSPAALAADDLYQRVRRHEGDAAPLLREFASAADEEADGAKGAQWSYRRDLGAVRLLVIDSRCGRVLANGRRTMVSEPEFAWIEQQAEGDYDHLLVGTSLPWLLPRALHDVESWDEPGRRGLPRCAHCQVGRETPARRRSGALGLDARVVRPIGRPVRRRGPRPIQPRARQGAGHHLGVLSGDVHHAYVAAARYPHPMDLRVYQLTCSPMHNYVPVAMKLAFRLSWSVPAERAVRFVLGRFATMPPMKISWGKVSGPYFGNQIATLQLTGRAGRLAIESATGANDRISPRSPR